jgi:uncharacterized membrane protein/glutaredoxin
MMRVTLFTKPDCPLCDEAREQLLGLQKDFPHELVEVDINTDATLRARYAEEIPVMKVGPYELRGPFGSTELRVTLGAAMNGRQPAAVQTTAPANRDQAIFLNRVVLSFSRHWLAVFNLLIFIYVGLPFAAPTLMKLGATTPASWIYKAYSPLCHQLAFRSWFLFGEQPAYPRAIAGTNLISYGEATGLSEDDYWGARAFIGNEKLGYKVAFCERDVAIYAGMFVAGLLFSLVRHRLPPLPLLAWFLVGIVPIALDGGTQLLSAIPLLNFPVRESTPLMRTLTGGLFGIMNVWLAYPYVEEAMKETRTLVAAKLAGAGLIAAGD